MLLVRQARDSRGWCCGEAISLQPPETCTSKHLGGLPAFQAKVLSRVHRALLRLRLDHRKLAVGAAAFRQLLHALHAPGATPPDSKKHECCAATALPAVKGGPVCISQAVSRRTRLITVYTQPCTESADAHILQQPAQAHPLPSCPSMQLSKSGLAARQRPRGPRTHGSNSATHHTACDSASGAGAAGRRSTQAGCRCGGWWLHHYEVHRSDVGACSTSVCQQAPPSSRCRT